MKHCLLLLALLSFTSITHVHADEGTIRVSGSASVNLVPDRFSVTFVAEARGESVVKLQKQVNTTIDNTLKLLLRRGVAQHHIQSMRINLSPWVEHSQSGVKERGFILSREVVVVHDQIEDFDRILDDITAAGIKRIQSFRLFSSEEENTYKLALQKAVQDAKLRAQLIASELDVKVGKVKTVSEAQLGSFQPEMKMMSAMSDAHRAMPGMEQINATVNVEFSVK